jgi:hypothetical protein
MKWQRLSGMHVDWFSVTMTSKNVMLVTSCRASAHTALSRFGQGWDGVYRLFCRMRASAVSACSVIVPVGP